MRPAFHERHCAPLRCRAESSMRSVTWGLKPRCFGGAQRSHERGGETLRNPNLSVVRQVTSGRAHVRLFRFGGVGAGRLSISRTAVRSLTSSRRVEPRYYCEVAYWRVFTALSGARSAGGAQPGRHSSDGTVKTFSRHGAAGGDSGCGRWLQLARRNDV